MTWGIKMRTEKFNDWNFSLCTMKEFDWKWIQCCDGTEKFPPNHFGTFVYSQQLEIVQTIKQFSEHFNWIGIDEAGKLFALIFMLIDNIQHQFTVLPSVLVSGMFRCATTNCCLKAPTIWDNSNHEIHANPKH